uniref:Ovule protein n=1 Tax=Caenorhabditis tropicalis TaxID=1561998 RepID=A0A1I7TDX2_9PELO
MFFVSKSLKDFGILVSRHSSCLLQTTFCHIVRPSINVSFPLPISRPLPLKTEESINLCRQNVEWSLKYHQALPLGVHLLLGSTT